MTLAIYFHPQSLSAEQYDHAIKELEAAGAASPAGRIHHSCLGPDGDLRCGRSRYSPGVLIK